MLYRDHWEPSTASLIVGYCGDCKQRCMEKLWTLGDGRVCSGSPCCEATVIPGDPDESEPEKSNADDEEGTDQTG